MKIPARISKFFRRQQPVEIPGIKIDLHEDGVLWLINKAAFQPRGYSLCHFPGSSDFWLIGDGTEPWRFSDEVDDEKFRAIEDLFARAATTR